MKVFKIIYLIPLFIVGSWLIIHGLAVFGIFIAFAYPLWWLFFPKQTICLLCRAEPDHSKCPFCRKTITKKEGTSPKNFKSAFLNGLMILLFSVMSIGLVFAESQVLFKFGFPPTPKTASFIIPAKGQYRVGEIFPVKIEINNLKNSINAVQADLGFDPEKIEVVSISTENSFANIFIQKEINNKGGWSRLTGGLANPGFFGQHADFGTIYFKAKSPGLVKIDFLQSSMVLANDGRGTNILKDLPSVSYLILPEKISTEEDIEQQKLISKLNVLGASSKKGELDFTGGRSVLAAQTEKEINDTKQFKILGFVLKSMEETDRTILSFWNKITTNIR